MKHDNVEMLGEWWLSSSIGCVCTYSTEGNDRRMEMYTTSTSMQNIESNLTSPTTTTTLPRKDYLNSITCKGLLV